MSAKMKMTRRSFVAASTAITAAAILPSRSAHAAEFEYKMGHSSPGGASVPQAAARSVGSHREGNRRAHDADDLPGEPARRRQRPAVAGAQRRRRFRPARRPHPRLDPAGRRRQRHGLRLQGLRAGVGGDRRRPRRLHPRADRRQGGARADGEALGPRLPPDHDVDEADREGRRPGRPETARARRARAGVAVHRAWRISGQHAVRRGLYVAADPASSTGRRIRCR